MRCTGLGICAMLATNPLAREMQRPPEQANGNTPYAPGRAFVEGATVKPKISDKPSYWVHSPAAFALPVVYALWVAGVNVSQQGQCAPGSVKELPDE